MSRATTALRLPAGKLLARRYWLDADGVLHPWGRLPRTKAVAIVTVRAKPVRRETVRGGAGPGRVETGPDNLADLPAALVAQPGKRTRRRIAELAAAPATAPAAARPGKIDLSRAPSAMEQAAESWRRG